MNKSIVFILITTLLSISALRSLHAAECSIPAEAQFEDVSTPNHVVGTGTAASCTSEAFVQAVAQGGIITFDCGPEPVIITLTETAKIYNNTGPKIVIDGGNKVTLSGGGDRRILYMNTCDQNLVWTTSHCQNQDHPQLTIQNLTFADGNSTGLDPDGGGAVWVRGGRFKILHCRFVRNQCDKVGPDVGGGAVRVFSQYNTQPVYVVDSVFGGTETDGNVCSNGGGLSSIGVSFTVINSIFSHNKAIGNGGNPAQPGTPGGGSGAAIYNDGNTFHLKVCGTAIHDNQANQYGGSIFFVSNNNTGTMSLENSALWNNSLASWLTHDGGISYKSNNHPPTITNCIRTDDEIFEKYQTIDLDGDQKIGLVEILYALRTISTEASAALSPYARKIGDIDYNHELNLVDILMGLQLITSDNVQ